MLADLASVGISLRRGTGPEQILVGREKIEKGGFEVLLIEMGEEPFDLKTFTPLEPFCDDVWHFDVEAIEDHGSYVRIAENCRRLAGGDLKFEDIRDYVDIDGKVAWLEVSINGRRDRVDFKVDNDWVDPVIFAKLQEWLGEAGSERRFAVQGLGQDLLLICKSPEEINRINRKTGLRFRDNLNI